MPATLCDLAFSLPRLVGALLDREAKLKRGRFREETLTDLFTGALAAFAGPDLVIEYPAEDTTGGDIDLDFWDVAGQRHLALRIQAKRLNAASSGGKPVAIQNRSYRELLHKVPKTGNYQFETLHKTSGTRLPLYMFYNHGAVLRDPYFTSVGPKVRGINLAFADDIRREMRSKLGALPKRLHYKRLSHLRPHLFGLEAILCPGALSGVVPTPEAVSNSLRLAWNAEYRGQDGRELEDRIWRLLSDPASMKSSRRDGRLLRDGPAIRVTSAVDRATVTFISGRTKDDRTPKITNDEPNFRD